MFDVKVARRIANDCELYGLLNDKKYPVYGIRDGVPGDKFLVYIDRSELPKWKGRISEAPRTGWIWLDAFLFEPCN